MQPRTTSRISTAALCAGGFVLLALSAVLAFQRGGFQSDDQLRALAVSSVVLAVVAVAAPWPIVRGRAGLVVLCGLAGLAVWTRLSVDWARIEITADNDAWRVALYAVFFAAALIVMRAPAVRRVTPWLLLGSICAASVYGLGTRLLPDIFEAEVFGNAGARLSHPITYWNGLGILAGTGLLLGIACAAERGAAPRALRAIACALAVPCGLAFYMTLSRGAFVAVFAGLVVLLVMRPRIGTALTAGCVLLPVGGLVALLQAFDEVRAVPGPNPVQGSQGELMAALVIGAAIFAAAAFALLAGRIDGVRAAWRPRFRTAAIVGVTAVVAILVVTVAISYASEQSEELSTSTSRVTEAKTFRGPYWDVALQAFADHPLGGVGSGSFRVEWRRENVVPRGAFDAHSLYFETLGELGIVGGLLLATVVIALAAGLVRRAGESPRDPVLPAAAAVLGAYAVHLGVDWDWELPALILPVLLLAAAALVRPERDLSLGLGWRS